MNNRRNFYRILHVQPEAPLEIIKASYRSLMSKLKAHPDLGGNHEAAVLINQAYAVLNDPQKRRQYDEMLRSRKKHNYGNPANHEKPVNASRAADSHHHSANSEKKSEYSASSAPQHCFFCGFELSMHATKLCLHCSSPLFPVKPVFNKHLGELFGRRLAPRISKAGTLIIYPTWPHPGYPARLRDLSPTGISLLTEYGARSGQLLKLESTSISGVARIVSVRANGANFSLHASLLTVEFTTKTGVFVTEKA